MLFKKAPTTIGYSQFPPMLLRKPLPIFCFILLFLSFVFVKTNAQVPCNLTDVLSVNTGYNHVTSTTIPHNQRDTFWKVTAISAKSASYFPAIPALPYSSYAIVGLYWTVTRSSTSEWISFLPNGTYTEIPPNGLDSLWTEYSRDFKICELDTFSFKLEITNDNFCKKIMVDGIPVPPSFPYSEPSVSTTTSYTTWVTVPTFTMVLSPGIHRLTFRQHNYPVGRVIDNPVGLSVKGTISSVSARKRIVDYSSSFDCSCKCAMTVIAHPKDTSICFGDSVILSASGAMNYKWSPSLFLSDTNVSNPIFKGNSTKSYVVEGSDTSGCKGYDTVLIKVNPLPIISILPKNFKKCDGDTIKLLATGGLSYQWTPSAGLNSALIANPILTVSQASNKIFVKGTDVNGCSNVDSASYTVVQSPIVVAAPHDTFGCVGTEVQLFATGAKNFKWTPSAGLNKDDIANPKLSIISTLTYVVKGTDSIGCVGYDTLRVTAFPIPKLKIVQQKINDNCLANESQLNASGAFSYSWSPAIYCSNSTIPNPIANVPYTLVFTVTGTNEYGCKSSDTITVHYGSKSVVRIPNAFTPNGDEINDKFKPIIVCGFDFIEFSIYNRWGEQVYITNNQNKAWDGNFKGVEAELGVYFYMLKGKNSDGEDVLMKGDVTLIR